MWMWIADVWLACIALLLCLVERAPIWPDEADYHQTTVEDVNPGPSQAAAIGQDPIEPVFIVHLLHWKILVCSAKVR
jgi:hypothetical protein